MLLLSVFANLPKPAQLATIAGALVTRYLFSDWEFLVFLLVFVALSGVTGFVADFHEGKLSRAAFRRFLNKIFIYSILLIMAHGLTHFKIQEVVNWLFKTIDSVIYTGLMANEAISIISNVTRIDPELIPPAVSTRLIAAVASVPNRVLDYFAAKPLTDAPEAPAVVPEPIPEAAPEPAAPTPQ